jgi:DNA-binding IclR family transcriptional regulator
MLLDFVSESGEANRESLLEAAAALKIPPSEVDGILERLRLEGFVYCPRHGVFKVV